MSDPTGPRDSVPTPGDIRPRRTLGQPPSARFERADSGAVGAPAARQGPLGAGTVAGIVILGTAAIIVLHAVLAVTTGLLAIAALVGYLLGQALRAGGAGVRAGGTGDGPAAGANSVAGAIVLALAVVAAGAIGSWLVAIPQGNQLGIAEYLGQTVGIVLPAQALAAVAGAWLGSR